MRFPFLHRCRYGHTWEVQILDAYIDPSQRFCRECLEEHHIEVASIQLYANNFSGCRVRGVCRSCGYEPYYLLLQDAVVFMTVERTINDHLMTKIEPLWFALPSRWPQCRRCFIPLTLKEFSSYAKPSVRPRDDYHLARSSRKR